MFVEDPSLTPRRVLTLLGQLPEGSAFKAALAGGPSFRGWDYDRYLMKTLIDIEQYHIYVLRAMNGDKKAQIPKPLWSPLDEKKKREQGQSNFMAQMRAARAALAFEKKMRAEASE